ncbi:hypothetical protein CspeluHIS016_0703660 [Cutaneotrichosporon spelunceum]|uniref:Uncharacterized protein n=1 Tax=Cutaneotrichosporon spelunceum TaxID=1672016 RepID=A0AAD3TYR7_9TREE|nr:hypothetical protein CspeluHIS016_0703660 [Cutaneotrichosporon spelunceum]
MSALRRSSSPLSSASPSPPQVPTGASRAPLTALNLGTPATADDEPGIVGGSSPTTLTEPLTESDLTEDEEEMDEPTNELGPVDDDALDVLSDIGDEDEADGGAAADGHMRQSPEGSPLSPSPSLTPPRPLPTLPILKPFPPRRTKQPMLPTTPPSPSPPTMAMMTLRSPTTRHPGIAVQARQDQTPIAGTRN